MKVLRTKTRNVGTESYRAPEVNSGLGYDPSFADVWSLGVMLFFFVRMPYKLRKLILFADSICFAQGSQCTFLTITVKTLILHFNVEIPSHNILGNSLHV